MQDKIKQLNAKDKRVVNWVALNWDETRPANQKRKRRNDWENARGTFP